MDGPERNKSEEDKYHMISTHLYTHLQNRNRPTDLENKLIVTKGKSEWEE